MKKARLTNLPDVQHPRSAHGSATLHKIAFHNAFLATIIYDIASGEVLSVNKSALKLLGYRKEDLPALTRKNVFNESEPAFKKMIRTRKSEGRVSSVLTVFKKAGESFSAAVTSAAFIGEQGKPLSIYTIEDLTDVIEKQIKMETFRALAAKRDTIRANAKHNKDNLAKAKKVAKDIKIAKTKQKEIDTRNRKKVKEDTLAALDASAARLKENNHWLKQIAKTSYDVMWDWDMRTDEIYVGDSVKEVFGYSAPKNLISLADFKKCLPAREKVRMDKRLSIVLKSTRKNWAYSFTLARNDGSVAAVAARASIIRNKQGVAIRLIGAIKDVTKIRDLQEQLKIQDQQSEDLILASHLPIDVLWERNLPGNEMILGDGFARLLKMPDRQWEPGLTDWIRHLHPEDKDRILKSLDLAIYSSTLHWEESYRFVCHRNSVVKVTDKATILRNTANVAYKLMGAMRTITRQEELETNLELEVASKQYLLKEYSEKFSLMFKSSSMTLFDLDLRTSELSLSNAFRKKFTYTVPDQLFHQEDWIEYIHPDDKEGFVQSYMDMLQTRALEWKYQFRLLRSDKTIEPVICNSIIFRDHQHNAYRIMGSIESVIRGQTLEDDLKHEVRLKEKEFAAAMDEARETERSNIGKELHDNVNQLLGVSKLYLEMAKRGGPDSGLFLNRSSEYTMTAIEEIRKLTRGLTNDTIRNHGLRLAIENMVQDTIEISQVKIRCKLDHSMDDIISESLQLNIYRIIQEQLNNILKHAGASKISVRLAESRKIIKLIIKDNGVGFDLNLKRKGSGLNNIDSRAKKFGGTTEFVSEAGKGCLLTVSFPK